MYIIGHMLACICYCLKLAHVCFLSECSQTGSRSSHSDHSCRSARRLFQQEPGCSAAACPELQGRHTHHLPLSVHLSTDGFEFKIKPFFHLHCFLSLSIYEPFTFFICSSNCNSKSHPLQLET